jgi:hypothetical protein
MWNHARVSLWPFTPGKPDRNNQLGPDLSLSLNYTPLSTENTGFGTFSLGLTHFNNRTNLLELSNGEKYRVIPGTDTVRNKSWITSVSLIQTVQMMPMAIQYSGRGQTGDPLRT